MSFSRPTQPKPYRQRSHTTLNQLAPCASPLNGSCPKPMVNRTLGLASGTKKRNQKRQISRERRIKVVTPPAGPTCSVRSADAHLIKDRILETVVLISNRRPPDRGRGRTRLVVDLLISSLMRLALLFSLPRKRGPVSSARPTILSPRVCSIEVGAVTGVLVGVRDDVLGRGFIYWNNVNQKIGKWFEDKVRSSVTVSSGTADDVVITEDGSETSDRPRLVINSLGRQTNPRKVIAAVKRPKKITRLVSA